MTFEHSKLVGALCLYVHRVYEKVNLRAAHIPALCGMKHFRIFVVSNTKC